MTIASLRRRKLAALEDPELMAAGSVEAFGELYDRYCDRAYRVARAVCRDDGHAEDAVQDAFLSVWRTRASYQSQRGPVAAWLLTTVRYRAIDLMRVNGKHLARRADEDQLEAHAAPGDVAERVIHRDETDRLKATLAMLPDAQKEVITLAYYGQLSHTEIAAHLGLPSGTVKGRMRLGLQKLRDTMERQPIA
ncbi:MAG TPA: sigma-70 family RNA polymerase sigma factor [Solirubrobacteraceae bacterium]|nr:sigma-70 family RNA polymerase sigma factor [Solirubrobacteraceae bacterium]